ncbi:MAG: DUF2310 family Zn-ribbon-containing protein [Planctomycetaceae bacterium]
MLTRITFRRNDDLARPSQLNADTRFEYEDAADCFVGTLEKYDHIYRGYSSGWCGGSLHYYVNAAQLDAIDPKHFGKYTSQAHDAVAKAFGAAAQVQHLEDATDDRQFTRWEDSSSLYLFFTAFRVTAPVTCGDSGDAIPSYQLPISDETREGLYFWASEYQANDRLWFASGALELPTYRQLADPTSELSQAGRDLCKSVEDATEKPTYYYMMRYHGRLSGEETRACPGCGDTWHVRDEDLQDEPFHNFHFRCETCRLVSSVASNCEEGEEHAEIGEFHPASK